MERAIVPAREISTTLGIVGCSSIPTFSRMIMSGAGTLNERSNSADDSLTYQSQSSSRCVVRGKIQRSWTVT